jgi:UDP-N-acetylmuramoyl-tripeptide--D-alanyl-D-alanine ligase
MSDAPLWTLDSVVAATGGGLLGDPGRKAFGGVAIDSRTTAAGDIFVAIRGEKLDGHDFVVQALEKGAGLAIVSRHDAAMRRAGLLLEVDDALVALEGLGVAARRRSMARIAAVTGSVGKTSTKEALRLALTATGSTHASAASYNNQWGVPLSLARLPPQAAFAVFEIGMNHAGEITPLVRMVRPHVAIVTTIAESHLGYFGSLAAIADAKAEIFLGVEPGGAAVITRDSPYFPQLWEVAREAGIDNVVSFGAHPDADVRLDTAVLHEECACVKATVLGETVAYRVGAPGRHMVMNSLAVLAAVRLLGADLALGALRLAELMPARGRGVRLRLKVPDGNAVLIDESYNANPTSMRAALALLGQTAPGRHGRRIAILGDMLELGADAAQLHVGLVTAIDAAATDVLYACGPNMALLWNAVPAGRRGAYAATAEELKALVAGDVRAGDVIMVKGSLGSRMGPLVEALVAKYPPGAE